MRGALLVFLLFAEEEKSYTRKRKHKTHRDCIAVIDFIHSWSGNMFQRQFRLSKKDVYFLEDAMCDHKITYYGYDEEKHNKFAMLSSGSPATLELRLFIMLRILSGASY